MPDGRGFFLLDKEVFCGKPDGLQGKATQYGGKKTAQTAFNGCEYRFLTLAEKANIAVRLSKSQKWAFRRPDFFTFHK
jgi:hypothetical protein